MRAWARAADGSRAGDPGFERTLHEKETAEVQVYLGGGRGTMWLYLLPALLINVAIILVPAVLTIVLAFFKWERQFRIPSLRRRGKFSGARQ